MEQTERMAIRCSGITKTFGEVVANDQIELSVRFGEIDLIAEQEGALLFVEVKLRTNLRYGMPRESVTAKKQEKLRSAALLYLSMHGLDAPARFDVAEVYTDVHHSARSTRIEYIENAF